MHLDRCTIFVYNNNQKGVGNLNNYTIYHCHTDISNLSGAGMDSVTKYQDYVARAKECGMNALCFSEHGNFFLWKKKKDAIEAAGMKYLHGIEIYVAEKLWWETEDNPAPHKVRDNYHCVLIAKNLAGLKELNKLSSIAFREEQRYYSPRITFEQLINTSDNIIITTACVGGILCKGNEDIKNRFIEFLAEHKDRCFLEIQHHNVEKQKEYNLYLYELSQKYGIPLIAGTDTHALNDVHAEARLILQKAKKNEYNDDEAGWDLTFKTYDELVEAYRNQNCLPEKVYLEAIQNTNIMADMVENITLDTSFKYPKVFRNPTELLRSKLFSESSIKYAMEDGFTHEQVIDRLNEEMETFIAVDAVDYILLQEHIARWCHEHDIWCGPARGSAASSLALYILHVTEVNPMKHNFAFWRFMNKDKYSLADVDLDWGNEDRDRTKYWMLHDKMGFPNMQTTEIITFNTLGLKSAIRDFGRGLNVSLETVSQIAKAVHEETDGENKKEVIDESWRKKYPKLFKYVDLAQGVCTSIGAHASGVVAASTDVDLEAEIGTCYLKGDEYLVSVLNMKELDSLNFVKEDVLGLTNISCINKSCKLANIPKLSAKTIDVNDDKVWNSIRDDTSLIFELNSPYGARTVSQMYSEKVWNKIKKSNPSITKFDLFAYISALIRPCGKGVYPKAVQGDGYVSGVKDIDNLLASEMGYPIMQESQMSFVQEFCGYTFLQADKLRKIIGKKLGTKEQLPIIRKGFEENAKVKYSLSGEKTDEIMDIFLNCVLYATRYSFSSIHAYSYTYISYECAWLRYYYPFEFLSCCLNEWQGNSARTAEATAYAMKHGIKILPPKFRHSKAEYFPDKEASAIYKGIGSVKFMNQSCADDLYNLRGNHYNSFVDLLRDIYGKTSVNARQLDILIKLDFFEEFGNSRELLRLVKMYDMFGKAKKIGKEKLVNSDIVKAIVERHSISVTKAGKEAKSYSQLDNMAILNECETLIMSLGIKPMTIKEKADIQKDYMGYIDLTTGRQEDRPKLYVIDIKELRSKATGRVWARQITAQSIGSGKQSNYTITSKNYHEEFQVGDVILCKHLQKQKDYWHITNYEVLINI